MDPVSLILTALVAGAAAAAKDTATAVIKDTYSGLKGMIQKRFAGNSKAEAVLTEYEYDAETWQKPLQKWLVESGTDKDEAVLRQAQQIMHLVQPHQAAQGKYNVQIGDAKGTVIGDNATVTQTFGKD